MEQVLYFLSEVLVNAVIIAMLFWIMFWDCERTNPIRRHLIPKVYRPFAWLGLNAEWTMFTPDPPRRDVWPMAILTMSDGSKRHWEPKPYAELSVFEKIKYKKILKFYFQVTGSRADNQIKRDFVEYLLRRDQSMQTCAKIELFSVARDTLPFGQTGFPSEPYKKLIFTFYPIPPEAS